MTWFNRLRNWTTDASNGIGIRADYHDSEDNNFASGINLCLNIAGNNSPTANIPMGGFKLTGLASGTASGDSATFGQLQSQIQSGAVKWGATSSGSSNAYTISLTPPLGSYTNGLQVAFIASFTNSGAATININGLGAKNITKNGTTTLAASDILINEIIILTYDGTQFQVSVSTFTSPLTTKGDIYAFGTVDSRLAVGSNGLGLLADSTQSLGVKWGTVITSVAATAPISSSTTAGAATLSYIRPISSISSQVTLDATYNGGLVNVTSGTFSILITAAATLATGWSCTITNSGTGLITLDPNASETIDTYTTVELRQGQSMTITCNGSNFLSNARPVYPTFSNRQIFTVSGTFTVPAGVYKIFVECYGGGASGGGNNGITGGGGGGGGYSEAFQTVTPATAITATVATSVAGVSGTSVGNNGTSTSFNGITCNGGTGGTAAGGSAAGGTASGGDINISGTAGGSGASTVIAGSGGSCMGRYGGKGGIMATGSSVGGLAGGNYGGGGSGEFTGSTSGAGAAGLIVVWW